MAIPPEDSAALMEGMMLHRQGLACMAKTREGPTAKSTTGGAAAAAATAVGAAVASAPDGGQNKKARRRPLSPPTPRQHQPPPGVAGCPTSTASVPCATTSENAGDSNGSTEGGKKEKCGGESGPEEEAKKVAGENKVNLEQGPGGWEERKESDSVAIPQGGGEKSEEHGEGKDKGKGKGPLREADDGVDHMDIDSDAAAAATDIKGGEEDNMARNANGYYCHCP